MKNGFTLMEVLLVIGICALVGVASITVYERTNRETDKKELKRININIQNGAKLYMDINDYVLNGFIENNEVNIKLGKLMSDNYISPKLKNPVNNEAYSENYIIHFYIANSGNKTYMDSCIIEPNGNNPKCISNSEGEACGCCNYAINNSNPAC